MSFARDERDSDPKLKIRIVIYFGLAHLNVLSASGIAWIQLVALWILPLSYPYLPIGSSGHSPLLMFCSGHSSRACRDTSWIPTAWCILLGDKSGWALIIYIRPCCRGSLRVFWRSSALATGRTTFWHNSIFWLPFTAYGEFPVNSCRRSKQ